MGCCLIPCAIHGAGRCLVQSVIVSFVAIVCRSQCGAMAIPDGVCACPAEMLRDIYEAHVMTGATAAVTSGYVLTHQVRPESLR